MARDSMPIDEVISEIEHSVRLGVPTWTSPEAITNALYMLKDYKQLKDDYLDLDRQLRDAKSRADARWISVEDRMPDKNLNEHQIVYMKSGMVGLTSYGNYYSTDGKWVILGYEVTHWMPLPELPEKEDKS